jgi:hypothetical protein
MLTYPKGKEIEESLVLIGNDQCNASDHEILTHTRALLNIVRACEAQLGVAHEVLMQRRSQIDGVVWQINEMTTQLSQPAIPLLDPCGNIVSEITQ